MFRCLADDGVLGYCTFADTLVIARDIQRYIGYHSVPVRLVNSSLGCLVSSIIKQSLKGDIVTPDDGGIYYPGYSSARRQRGAQSSFRCLRSVKNTGGIAITLKYARANDLQAAIR